MFGDDARSVDMRWWVQKGDGASEPRHLVVPVNRCYHVCLRVFLESSAPRTVSLSSLYQQHSCDFNVEYPQWLTVQFAIFFRLC